MEMESSTIPSRNYGVLVVDDEPLVRYLLNLAMRREGFDVWLARDGGEAINVYRRHHDAIDVVLMDVCMPVLDGPRTLAALKQLTPDIPCCFMSGHLGSYTAQDLRNAGAAGYLKKPFQLADVASTLWELVRKPEPASVNAMQG